MSVALYFDVHVRQAVTDGLRLREVDVLTAQEDGMATIDDPVLLDRAMALGRIIFTQDEDFLREAHRLYGSGRDDVDYVLETFPIVRRKDEQHTAHTAPSVSSSTCMLPCSRPRHCVGPLALYPG